MALCTGPCCNKAARDAIRDERVAEFEAYLAVREQGAVEPAKVEHPVEHQPNRVVLLSPDELRTLESWLDQHPAALASR